MAKDTGPGKSSFTGSQGPPRAGTSPLGENAYKDFITILLVEDDPQLVENMILILSLRWPKIILLATPSGLQALRLVQNSAPDIILLDLTLADLYGLQVLRELRAFLATPVLIITANGEEISRLKSFELGTTDYVVKPFSHLDLLGSIAAALRHIKEPRRAQDDSARQKRGLVIDLLAHRILQDGLEQKPTPAEWALLHTLLRNHGKTTPYPELAEEAPETKPLAVSDLKPRLQQLQIRIGDDPQQPVWLQPEVDGYRLDLFS